MKIIQLLQIKSVCPDEYPNEYLITQKSSALGWRRAGIARKLIDLEKGNMCRLYLDYRQIRPKSLECPEG